MTRANGAAVIDTRTGREVSAMKCEISTSPRGNSHSIHRFVADCAIADRNDPALFVFPNVVCPITPAAGDETDARSRFARLVPVRNRFCVGDGHSGRWLVEHELGFLGQCVDQIPNSERRFVVGGDSGGNAPNLAVIELIERPQAARPKK
jgi:hypothetical protein